MGKVTVEMSMSLDGFITGPNEGLEHPLGEGGDRLHEWVYGLASWRERHGLEGGTSDRDAEVLEEAFASTGAVLMGRGMFDLGDPQWGEDPPFHVPVFVVTHEARETLPRQGGTSYTFVTGGVEQALEQARAAAGDGGISVAGGANIVQQCLRAGSLDEIQLHVVPLLLGDGVRLFDGLDPTPRELEITRVIDSPGVTHVRYRVGK